MKYAPKSRGQLTWLVSISILLLGLSSFDQRNIITKTIETTQNSNIFNYSIPKNATIFWENKLLPVWLSLNRSSYINQGQLAGLLFNRETATLASNRLHIMDSILTQMAICNALNSTKKTVCQVSEDAYIELCKSNDKPDFIVSHTEYNLPKAGIWPIKTKKNPDTMYTFYLYECNMISTQTRKL